MSHPQYVRAREATSDLRTITAGELSRLGAFKPPYPVLEFVWPKARAKTYYLPESPTLAIQSDVGGSTHLRHVEIALRDLPFGTGREFVCPCCGEQRRMLIVDDAGELICGPIFRSTPGNLSHSKRRVALQDARTARVCEAVAEQTRTTRKKRTDAFSTHRAIEFARTSDKLEPFLEFLEIGRPALDRLASGPWREPVSPDFLGSFTVLDIRQLAAAGWLSAGELKAWELGWDRRDCEGNTLTLAADLRAGQEPAVFVAMKLPSEERFKWQHISLKRRSGVATRWTFVCPVRNMPVETLYFRTDHFASRQAQRLYHPSQQKAGRVTRTSASRA